MRQTQVNNQILFALPPSAQLSMLNSDSLRCFCPFLIFLACWIPAQTHWSVPRTQLLTLTEFRASHMRCAPGYRHNDITGLIIGKPNTNRTKNIIIANQVTTTRNCKLSPFWWKLQICFRNTNSQWQLCFLFTPTFVKHIKIRHIERIK